MNKSITITIDLTNSPHVTLALDEALSLLKCIEAEAGETSDLLESIRIINNFEEFYEYLKRKFRDYITPAKDHREALLGKVVVHKMKLLVENSKKLVELVFDRRFSVDYLKKCLTEIGYSEIAIEKQAT